METSTLLGGGALVAVVGFLMLSVTGLPEFGKIDDRHVGSFYLQEGLNRTGSANIVNAIVWDFRGFDTLGEETVLFCSALGVFMIIRRRKIGRSD
jgi:multisubunit Na+/H+ antiporter MnhB subunit